MAGTVHPGVALAAGALAWLGGMALQMTLPQLWPPVSVLAVAVGAFCAGVGAWLLRRWSGLVAVVMLSAAVAGLAFATTHERAAHRLAQHLPQELEGQDLVLTGVVAALPQTSSVATRFDFEVESVTRAGQSVAVPPKVSLSWGRGFDGEALISGPDQELRAGQRWRLSVRLKRPHGTLNPHGFDAELWLFEQGLRATGSVRATQGSATALLEADVAHPVERLRQRVRDAITLCVPDPTVAGVLAALSIGDQAAIERAEWELFRITGVAHLMSISGLHVTMFAWLAAAVVARCWRCSPRAMHALSTPLAARWGGVALAAGYAVVSGWGVPSQRTVWMLLAVAALRTLAVQWPAMLVLLASAVAVTAIDPWAILQVGFWLSFAAVALLMLSGPEVGYTPAQRLWDRWRGQALGMLRTQAVATLGLAPLTLVFFQQISLVGFAANLLAIPLVTFVITPLALAGMLVSPLWWLAAQVVAALMSYLNWLASFSWAVWTAAAASPLFVCAGLAGAGLALMRLPWRLRAAGAAMAIPLLWPAIPRPGPGEFETLVADIGQGTSVLVRTREHLLVYDTGPQYSPESDAGQRVLLPLLRARGERRVDLLMLSHRDADHVGGAASLLQSGLVREMRSSLEPTHPLLARGVPHRRCDAGERWEWDGVVFELLHPRAEEHVPGAKPNTVSCVLKVSSSGGRSLLLTGDLEAAQELALVQRLGAGLKSDVLVVPHHGSRTSSTPAFLDAVAPRVAVVQAAYRSRYGHPAPDVMARYTERGIEIRRSDTCGAFSTWPETEPPRAVFEACERQRSARYWHHRP